jgi:dipeptidase E
MNRQIIAMGGGGFSMEPENPLLDQYILNASQLEKPKVCFVPTASGDSAGYVERFYAAFKNLECEPSHLSLFNPHTWTDDLEPFLAQQNVLYFGGGNTKNALVLWREWNLEPLLRTALERGAVLAGLSAGAICWFEQGSTDSVGRELGVLPCLGWLKGSMTPHYDGEAERRPKLHQFVLEGQIQNGFAADDGAALHFVNEKLEHVVSSRPTARAYKVELQADAVLETPLETRYLGI